MVVAFLPKVWASFRQLLPALFATVLTGRGDWSELVAAAIGVFGGFGAITDYLTTKFAIEGDHLVWTRGWLFKRDRRIPMEHIQNVNLRQGVLERALKVATVEVETAAGTESELKLQVLSEADAEAFRQELLEQLGSAAPALPQEPASEHIYRLSRQDLMLGAMTENQGLRVVAILSSLVSVGFMVYLIDHSEILSLIPVGLFLQVGVAATLLIMGVGWIFGAIAYLLRYSGFTVRIDAGTYRISHGLLARVQHALRRSRIEYVTLMSTLYQRMAGRCTLLVGTAGSFGEAAAIAPVGLMITNETSEQMISDLHPGFRASSIEWRPIPRFYLRVLMFRFLLRIAILAGFGYGTYTLLHLESKDVLRTLGIIGLGLVMILAAILLTSFFATLFGFKRLAYCISDEAIAVRGGLFKRYMSVVPMQRLELVTVTSPVFWRSRRLVELDVRAMAHSLQVPMLPEGDAQRVFEHLRRNAAARIRQRPRLAPGFQL